MLYELTIIFMKETRVYEYPRMLTVIAGLSTELTIP